MKGRNSVAVPESLDASKLRSRRQETEVLASSNGDFSGRGCSLSRLPKPHGDARSEQEVFDAFELAYNDCECSLTYNDMAEFLNNRKAFMQQMADDEIIGSELNCFSKSSKTVSPEAALEPRCAHQRFPNRTRSIWFGKQTWYGEQTWEESEPLQCTYCRFRPTCYGVSEDTFREPMCTWAVHQTAPSPRHLELSDRTCSFGFVHIAHGARMRSRILALGVALFTQKCAHSSGLKRWCAINIKKRCSLVLLHSPCLHATCIGRVQHTNGTKGREATLTASA